MKELDRKTGKLITIHGAHHRRTYAGRLYLINTKGGRGMIGVEDCLRSEQNSLSKYIPQTEENLLVAVL